MIVVIAGMYRSGSTFSFNVARELLLRRGSLHQSTGPDIYEALSNSNTDHILLRAHELDATSIRLCQVGGARVICTTRHPTDAVASLIEVFEWSEEEAVERIRQWLHLYQEIKGVALTVNYSEIDRRPIGAVRQMGKYLVGRVGVGEILDIARRYSKANVKVTTDRLERSSPGVQDIGFSWYDNNTYFHRRHISSLRTRSAEQRLPQEQVRRIEAALLRDAKELTTK